MEIEDGRSADAAGHSAKPKPASSLGDTASVPNAGGVKHDGDKSRVELLPTKPLLMIADVLGFGAQKYEAHNWRSGFEQSRLIGAAMRHLLAYNDGEDTDPESGLSHLAHLGCCALFLLEHQATGIGTDDRYKGDVT